MKKIKAFEIINHGYDHAQYFQGCGIALTPFEDVATGVGYSASEAYEDAVESLALDWDVSALPKRPRGIRKADHVPAKLFREEDNEFNWYVSIRVASFDVWAERG